MPAHCVSRRWILAGAWKSRGWFGQLWSHGAVGWTHTQCRRHGYLRTALSGRRVLRWRSLAQAPPGARSKWRCVASPPSAGCSSDAEIGTTFGPAERRGAGATSDSLVGCAIRRATSTLRRTLDAKSVDRLLGAARHHGAVAVCADGGCRRTDWLGADRAHGRTSHHSEGVLPRVPWPATSAVAGSSAVQSWIR